MIRLLPALLAPGYLLLAHAAASSDGNGLALLAGLVLSLMLLWPGLQARRIRAWAALLLLAAGLLWLQRQSLGLLPLYAPPVLLNLFLAWLFGHTLAEGRTPLIAQFMHAVHPPPVAPALLAYARRLTLAWSLLFVLLALLSLVLALLAVPQGLLASAGVAPPWPLPQTLWSLFANLFNYLIVGMFFVAEFAYRRRRFRDLPYRTLPEFVSGLAALGPAFWRRIVQRQ